MVNGLYRTGNANDRALCSGLSAESPEHSALSLAFPVLYSPLTTSDSHGWSEVLDVTLGQPSIAGPPMPIVYVVGSDGVITLARWGYQKATLLQACSKVAFW